MTCLHELCLRTLVLGAATGSEMQFVVEYPQKTGELSPCQFVLLNCLTDKKPSSEIATNVLPHFMVRTEHIFSKGLRKYAIILNHSQENHKPRNKCLLAFRAQKRAPVDPC